MNDELERRLRDDLTAHAERSTAHLDPATVSARWDEVMTRSTVRALPARPRIRTRVLTAAAGVAAVAVIGAGVVSSGGDQEVTSATPSTEAMTTTIPPTPPSTPLEESTDVIVEGPNEEPAPELEISQLDDGHELALATLATAAATPEAATATFLELIDVPTDQVSLVLSGDVVRVESTTEAGEWRVVSEVRVARTADDRIVVLDAQSPGFVVLDPAPIGHVGPMYPVQGRGHGFEATIDLRLHTVEGAPQTATNYATGDPFGEMLPFIGEHPVAGAGEGWVFASSSDPSGAVAPFAAVPGGWDSGRTGDARVFRIRPDDPDGGLVLRADPDSASDRLGVIPAGELVETFETDGPWVRVRDRRGVLGWAGSTFLTVSDAVITDDELLEVGRAFERAFVTERGNDDALAAVPWADDYVIPVGWTGAMIDFDAMALAAPGADGVVVEWAIPEDFTDERQRLSLASFLGLEDREYDLLPRAGCCVYGNQADIVDGWFAGLPTITFVDRQTSGWQNVHLFVEPTEAGPRIVGVAVEIWTP